MEWVRCNLCGSERYEELERHSMMLNLIEPTQIVRCRDCGLVFLNPRMTEVEYRELYDTQRYYDGVGYSKFLEVRKPYYTSRLSRLEAIMSGTGRILDIGCGTGEFLEIANSRGWECHGVEVSEWSACIAREKVTLQVIKGVLSDAGYSYNWFDAIHMNHVLEHLPNPFQYLAECFRLLRKDGILLVEVPFQFFSGGSLRQEFRRRLFRRPLIKAGEPSIWHLYYFSPHTLSRLVEKAGGKVIHLATRDYKQLMPVEFLRKPWRPLITLIDRMLLLGSNIELWAHPRTKGESLETILESRQEEQ